MNYFNEKKKSILVVEDDEVIRNLIVEHLKRLKYFSFIIEAKDGADAIHKLANQEFDSLIMDINIPVRNSIDILEGNHGRNIDPNKVIIISGDLDKDKISKLLKIGIKKYIVKPIQVNDLFSKIAKTLKISTEKLINN